MMQYFKYIITILFVDGICAKSFPDPFAMKKISTLTGKNITRLDLSHNNLLGLNRKTFNDYKKLEQLYIINSGVVFIDDGTFQDLHQLKELNIAQNFITRLTSKPFGPRNQLEKLVVSSNMLTDLDDFDINHFPNLKYFDISNNQLTHLPISLMKKLKENKNFTLITRGNDWNCTNQTWLKDMTLLTVYTFCVADKFQESKLPKPLPLKKYVEPNFMHCIFWVIGAFWIGIIVGNVFLIRKLLCKGYVEGKTHQATQQDSYLAVLYTVDPPKSMGQLHSSQ